MLFFIQRNSELFKEFKVGENIIKRELVIANKGVQRRSRGDESKESPTGERRAGFQPGEERVSADGWKKGKVCKKE